MLSHYAREQVREPRCVPEEGSLALQAAQLLDESEGKHLRVREPLERTIGSEPPGLRRR